MLYVVNKFLSLSFPVKLLIGAVAGSGSLAFLSEYATYYYALSENIRPPLEGIPYLSASVALASFVLSIAAICIFLFTRWILEKFFIHPVTYIRETFQVLGKNLNVETNHPDKAIERGINHLQGMDFWNAIPIILTTSMLFALFVCVFQYLTVKISGGIYFSFQEFKYLSIYFSIVLLTLWKPLVNSVIAVLCVVGFYLFFVTLLFSADHYANYLKIIKYGGNIPISLQYKDNLAVEKFVLVLRSRDYVFVRTTSEDLALELPIQNVRSIRYE